MSVNCNQENNNNNNINIIEEKYNLLKNKHHTIKQILREHKEKKTDPRLIISRLLSLYSWEENDEKEKNDKQPNDNRESYPFRPYHFHPMINEVLNHFHGKVMVDNHIFQKKEK